MTAYLGGRVADYVLKDHHFSAPLNHERADQGVIQLYAREVRTRDGADKPWLLYLQGGPGAKSPRPLEISGWLARATAQFRVLLLDQRGTGRSTPISRQTVGAFPDAAAQAAYLLNFRADSIVADCELIRRSLVGDDGRWSLLGQSFGGFCATTYLSVAPDHLDRVLITGGLPPLHANADDVYRVTYAKVRQRNQAFRQRYPQDEPVLSSIRAHLLDRPVALPGGDLLNPARLQYLGLGMGMLDGFEAMHYLLEEAWIAPGQLSDTFLVGLEAATSLTINPLFALLHEPCYSQGASTRWAAHRIRAENPDFAIDAEPFQFTGEMIYPWMFDSYAALSSMKAAADLLANREGWPALYNRDRLAANSVPVAALIYFDDMYVAREFSLETASQIARAQIWVTNEYDHDGLGRDGGRILDRLLQMSA